MLNKFSALIGVKQVVSVEPEVLISCENSYDCTSYPFEATFHWYNNERVFQHCGC
ncbi:hypothetical protein [Tumebacillus lipolyticus]|uniref:Ig-like domain-containing protein n=1 Tax=Tumebacillus lipolyticus TaxID=1280370 RepID=A0ABW4ZZK9_9BACL